jgi:hypothetical protein
MENAPKKSFDQLFNEAKKDQNIIGLFLGGSRGKGFENERSDYDIRMIVKDAAAARYKKRFRNKIKGLDLTVLSESEFSGHAVWLSATHWNRYDHTRAKALIDRTGKIQELIDDKGLVPKSKIKAYVAEQIDSYLNAFIRSIESSRKDDIIGIRLEAAISIPCFLNAVFGVEGRTAPFADYLVRELSRYPLKKFPWPSGRIFSAMLKILETGDLKTQQELERTVESFFRKEGYGRVFDAWDERLPEAVKFKIGN